MCGTSCKYFWFIKEIIKSQICFIDGNYKPQQKFWGNYEHYGLKLNRKWESFLSWKLWNERVVPYLEITKHGRGSHDENWESWELFYK